MNNRDHISESLETIFFHFWVKILKFFYADPGSWMEKIRIRDPGWKKFGSGMENIRIQDLGWKKFGSGMEKFGSGIRDGKNSDPDPLHCRQLQWCCRRIAKEFISHVN
jgi:hypothetical protein